MEIRKGLAAEASRRLKELGYGNVRVKEGDGYFGWPEHAPFDAVMITAAVDHIPAPLKEQLSDGSRLVLPLGSPWLYQTLTLVTREGDQYRVRYITKVAFVPMVGQAEK
jgi:protein-L-isoaspartate(D-aspartate) O-methyltransferase